MCVLHTHYFVTVITVLLFFKVFLCEDSGAVSIWTRGEQQNAWNAWTEQLSVAEHDDVVLAVDVLDPGQNYVTVGGDGYAKVCMKLNK